ncbi:MAG: rhomboid family intramembrane serine protease [Cytophagaceae bacterium]|nr:MAG: rhomboid family intramembrane serine protease [Cytophagaceae bacterium]
MPPLNPLLILLGLTVAVSAYAWSNQDLMNNWILDPYQMNRRGGQWYRLLTSGFLHADIAHLAFNMITFYSFGGIVLTYFAQQFGDSSGLLFFLLLYLGGVVVSDLPTYFQHRHHPGYRSLGASGGVSSVLFASIMLLPVSAHGGIGIFLIPIDIQPFLFGFLYLAYSYYMSRRRADNINHDAHFYGALYGVLLTVAIMPGVLPNFVQQIRAYSGQLLDF